jgi:hypothetical protein
MGQFAHFKTSQVPGADHDRVIMPLLYHGLDAPTACQEQVGVTVVR